MPDLSKVSARSRLKQRREPYWHKLRKACYLGFRRATGATSGTWLARIYDATTGKQKYQPLGDFGDLPESDRFDAAAAAASKWFDHIDAGGNTGSATVRYVCTRYVQHVQDTRGSAAAKDVERRFNTYVLSFPGLADVEATKLTPSHIDRWRSWVKQLPSRSGPNRGGERSAATLNRDVTCLRAALNLALLDGLVTSDQAWKKRLLPIRNADRRRSVFLTREQRLRLIDATPPAFKDFFTLLMIVPLRPGAAAALKVSDFNQERKALRVGKDKAGAARWVALPDSSATVIGKIAKNKLPNTPLAGSPEGRHWNKDQWKVAFARAAQQAELPTEAVLYSIRHGVITDLLHLGTDAATVAFLAGTSVRVIQSFYAHAVDSHSRQALERIAL